MNTSRRMLPVLAGFVLSLVLVLSASASAAPVTVNLRVEGSTKTLFEGPVGTEGIAGITTESSPTPEPCDFKDDGSNKGEGPDAATPTAALYDAAIANGLAFNAEWEGKYNDFFVSQVGTDVNQSVEPYDSWGYAVNYTTANVGGCQFQLAPGSEVLWAYNYFNLKHLLSLSGPASVTVGVPFTVRVTDGQTGEPISGAAIGQVAGGVTTTIPSSPLTNANGDATLTLSREGAVKLKATQELSVRSNGLSVSVAALASGCTCDLVPTIPGPAPVLPLDVARGGGVNNGHRYTRGSAPRLLSGTVEVPYGGTLRQVRISLQRRFHNRCFDFSGSRESFVRTKKCGSAAFFSVGGSESFSYLLPARLPKGSYIYDIEAIDSAGQATKLVSGISHVVFQVK